MTYTLFESSIPRRFVHTIMLAGTIMMTASVTIAAQNPNPADHKLPAVQLDTLVAPIALYSDPLLAQVMLAATFPDQIHSAAEYVRLHGTRDIDDQPWDVSVKAVAHYPTVVNMMDAKIDWTTALGQAYASQSGDLMQAVQDMRSQAQAQGNLVTTPQQEVVDRGGNIAIWPAQPDMIYVPEYDPACIYYRPCFGPYYDSFFSFGIGYPIGPWLMYDWDWPGRRIYYTAWMGGGWIGRSRPFIGFNSVYVNDRFRNVAFDRGVLSRPFGVDHVGHVRGFDGQSGFHREAAASAVERGVGSRGSVPAPRGNRALITRAQTPSTFRGAAPATRGYQGGASYTPRATGRPSVVNGYRGMAGGNVRQSAPAPRYTGAPRSAPAQRSAPASRGGGSRSSGGGGRSAGRGRA